MPADLVPDLARNALQLCMGAAFERLPPVIQRAHVGDIRLEGVVTVSRGWGLAGLVAAIMRLPATNPDCAMVVVGRHLPDRMIWQRDFAGRKMESCFVKSGDALIEAMGAAKLRLYPECRDGRLYYRLAEVRVGGMPLPRWFAPTLIAWEGEAGGFYEFEVEIGLPLLGRLVRYAGKLTLVSG